MTWLGVTIAAFLIGGIALMVRPHLPKGDRATGETGDGRVACELIVAACGLAWFILTLVSSINVIDAGHVGVIKTFGSIDGQVGDGPAFVAPWSDVIEVSTKAQRKEFDHLAAFSAETQDVFVDATVNLAIAPGDVQCLYRTVGSDWYEKLIPPRVAQTLKDETVKYSTTDIAPHREDIRKAVKRRLQVQLHNFQIRSGACKVSIDVQDFLLRNIDFNAEFKTAIERKQIATQDAQTARNKVEQAKQEARQKVETAKGAATAVVVGAKGDATATLVKATAQAEANRKLARSLTPELIRFTLVDKLAANVKTIIASNLSALVTGADIGLTGGK